MQLNACLNNLQDVVFVGSEGEFAFGIGKVLAFVQSMSPGVSNLKRTNRQVQRRDQPT